MFQDRKKLEPWTKGPPGFADKANRQLAAIEQRLPGVPVGQATLGITPIAAVLNDELWAKITDYDESGGYAWTEQERTASGWQDLSGGRSGTTSSGFAINENGTDVPVSGEPVVRMYADYTNGDPAYSFQLATSGAFGIKLTQTGGSAGDESTQCSFTYTVNDMQDNELATGVDPTAGGHYAQRPTVGLRIAATAGVATYVNGTLSILTINEIDDQEACEE